MNRPVKIEQHSSLGVLWLIGWLFSVGFLKMGFWQGALALLVWPYFLGAQFAHFADERPPETTAVQAPG